MKIIGFIVPAKNPILISLFRLVVALLREVHVFTFPTPSQRLYTVETRENTLGLCEISPIVTAERQLLAFPGHKIGSVQLVVSISVFDLSL